MQSSLDQKPRTGRSFSAVKHARQIARVGLAGCVKIRKRPVLPHRDQQLEGVVEGDAEGQRRARHAVDIGPHRRAFLRQREGLSEFARHRIAAIRAERRRRNEAGDERGRDASREFHTCLPPEFFLYDDDFSRQRAAINRRAAAETVAMAGLMIFVCLIAIGMAVFGDAPGMSRAASIATGF